VEGNGADAVSRFLIGAAGLFLIVALLVVGGFFAVIDQGGDTGLAPTDVAKKEIPEELIPLYQRAAAECPGLPWTVLAAIHRLETNFSPGGRVVSYAGAVGPMQFMPATWSTYGVDGNRDGRVDIIDLEDSVSSAANYLCANGAADPDRLRNAIWHYNHSDAYVSEVMIRASTYGVSVPIAGAALASQVVPGALLRNSNVILTGNARFDLETGVVDQRLIALLEALASRWEIGISVFKTGHSMYTASGSISLHYSGRAADIYIVSGAAVSGSNYDARGLVEWVNSLSGPGRPSEIGSPFPVRGPGAWTDVAHADHVHIGFD
jgi:hypothetical protein